MQLLLLDNNQLHTYLGKKSFSDSLGMSNVVHSMCVDFTKDKKTFFKSMLDSCEVQGHNIYFNSVRVNQCEVKINESKAKLLLSDDLICFGNRTYTL